MVFTLHLYRLYMHEGRMDYNRERRAPLVVMIKIISAPGLNQRNSDPFLRSDSDNNDEKN